MIKSLIGAFAGGIFGAIVGEFFGSFHLQEAIKSDHSIDLLISLARLCTLTGGGLGAVAGAVVGAAGDTADAVRGRQPFAWPFRVAKPGR
jgi:hypothetical protein